ALSAMIEKTTMLASSSSRLNSASPGREASSTLRAAWVTFRSSTCHSVAKERNPRRCFEGRQSSRASAEKAKNRLRIEVGVGEHCRARLGQERGAHPVRDALREVEVLDPRLGAELVLAGHAQAGGRALERALLGAERAARRAHPVDRLVDPRQAGLGGR